MPGELITDKGLILRNYNAKESDSVIHCLTQTHGKLHLYAKHARNSKRRFGGGLDPLTLGELEFKAAKDEGGGNTRTGQDASGLQFLESFRTIDGAHRYLDPFILYHAANLWVECVDHLSAEGDIQPGLFEIAKETLAKFTVLDTRTELEELTTTSIKAILVLTGFFPDDASMLELSHALTIVEEISQKPLKAKW